MSMADPNKIDFENKEYLKLSVADNDEYAKLLNGMLADGERIIQTYKNVRDGVVFTDRRLIAINVQGITGKKKSVTSLPYSKIQLFTVQTAGVIDIDSELYVWYAGIGKITFEFTSRSDVTSICRCMSQCMD